MKWVSLFLFALVLCLPSADHAVSQPATSNEQLKERVNENVLFIMGGQPGATFLQLTPDIAAVVNDGNNLRVLPVVGGAATENVEDVCI